MSNIPEKHLRSFPKEIINEMPLFRYEGELELVTTEDAMHRAVKSLAQEAVLGFDTETRPSFRKGVKYPPALLQLAGTARVYVFQFAHCPFSPELADLLADKNIVKSGVAVRDDIKDLRSIINFTAGNFIDIGEVSKKLSMKTHGLRNLAANLLGVRISKGVRCSNWAHPQLTEQQIAYAATDAYVSRELYIKLQELGAF